ncbi:MAG TPA: MauE/DoxX family redox-associated membrane protein [Gaiellaceae bacterium]|nr:MauE/DoxX family redox-associated membrane protein [Gaiellaceae bacterium]
MGLLRFCLAAVLIGAALTKLLAGARARDALRSYGIGSSRARTALWAATIAVEAVLGAVLAVGVPGAAEAAAALLGLFAVALVVAIAWGGAGAPCGCFGGRSRIGWPAVARTAALAAALAMLPVFPDTRLSTDSWLGIGLGVALVAVAALAVAVLALARELGELRVAIAPQSALSLDEEGPELGSRLDLIERFDRTAPLAIAVFTSPGCALCRALEPTLRLVASDPEVEIELFDEEADAETWRALDIPGSPYAVVLSADGDVLAKGTFNSLFQLESLLAHATRPVNA